MAIVFPRWRPTYQSPRRPWHRPCYRFADSFDRAVIRRQTALVALLQQVANPLFNGGIGRDGLQTAEVAAVAAFAQRVDLNMANFANVAVAADKNAPVGDNPRPGTAVHAHQNGVFAITACAKIVLGQRRAADIVANKAGNVEAFLQRPDQPQFSTAICGI